jgi:hypothetical protein
VLGCSNENCEAGDDGTDAGGAAEDNEPGADESAREEVTAKINVATMMKEARMRRMMRSWN